MKDSPLSLMATVILTSVKLNLYTCVNLYCVFQYEGWKASLFREEQDMRMHSKCVDLSVTGAPVTQRVISTAYYT